MLGTKSALVLTLGMLAGAFWYGQRQGGKGVFTGGALTLRAVNSPETEPLHGPVIRGYIDESPGIPNERGGQMVHPDHYGVSRQQSSGLL